MMLTNKEIQRLSFDMSRWRHLGDDATHCFDVSTCQQWVRKSPLTRCGVVVVKFDPREDIDALRALFKLEPAITASLVCYLNYTFYYQFGDAGLTLIARDEDVLSTVLSKMKCYHHPRQLSLFELDALAPAVAVHVALSSFYDESMQVARSQIQHFKQANPTMDVFCFDAFWVTNYRGVALADDACTEAFVLSYFNRAGGVLYNACIDGKILIYEGQILFTKVDWPVERDFFEQRSALHAHQLTQDLGVFCCEWEGRKPQTIKTVRALLYLIRHIRHDLVLYPITRNLLHVLDYCQYKHVPLTLNMFTAFAGVCAVEDHCLDLKNVYVRYALHQIISGVYETALMYYVGESRTLDASKVKLLLARPDVNLFAVNSRNQNALNMVLSLPSTHPIFVQMFLKIAMLDQESQSQLLQSINAQPHTNVFSFCAIHYPDLFDLLSQQEEHEYTWSCELSHYSHALDYLKRLSFTPFFIAFKRYVEQQTRDDVLHTIFCQLETIQLRFVLLLGDLTQQKQVLLDACVLVCEQLNQRFYLATTGDDWLSKRLYAFFKPVDSQVLECFSAFKREIDETKRNHAGFVLV